MSERERRTGTGGTEDNVRDDLDEATEGRGKREVTERVVEKEETGSSGGMKDNVDDDQEKTQERS